MHISTAPDTGKGPGYAVFTLQDDGSGAMPLAVDGAVFSIRSSSGASLGHGKWVQGKATFEADAIESGNGALQVRLGPSVIDHLDPMETYQLCMETGGGEYYGTFFLENVLPSSARVKDIPVSGPAEPVSAPETVAEPAPLPSFPDPRPQPQAAPVSVPPAAPAVPEPPFPVPPPRTSRSSSPFLIALLFLIALFAAGITALWFIGWFFGEDDGSKPVAPVASVVETVDSVRRFLATDPSPEAMQRRFADAEWDADNADARFLLAEQMAAHGDADALAVVGEFYDPTSSTPSGSIVKDAEQAHAAYKAAQAAGRKGLDEPLARLKKWVWAEGKKGSTDARRLLENW